MNDNKKDETKQSVAVSMDFGTIKWRTPVTTSIFKVLILILFKWRLKH